MKKILLGVLICFSAASLYAQPTIQNGTFYTQTGLRAINLAPLVTGGRPPYRFRYVVRNQVPPLINMTITLGLTPLTNNGMVEVQLMPGEHVGIFQFRVQDSDGAFSQFGDVTIIRGVPKG